MPGDVQNRILHRELRTNRYREQWIPPGAGAKAVATRGSRFDGGIIPDKRLAGDWMTLEEGL
jgi:hypothetical protein